MAWGLEARPPFLDTELVKLGLEPVTSLVRRSSLEDVFLRLTGRTLVE
ncbi:MAG: hypothetical protein EBZ87_06055, partial [Microbacteriaceae bacterium]|nr:hypothetical protein [Microbacteriaceae bacterium]